MIRTTLAFGFLFGGLLLGSKWLGESCPAPRAPAASAPATGAAQPRLLSPPSAAPLPALPPAAAPGSAAAADRGGEAIRRVAYETDELSVLLRELRAEQAAAEAEEAAKAGQASVSDEPAEESEKTPATEPASEAAESSQPAEVSPQRGAAPVEESPSATLPATPVEPELALTPELLELRGRLRECLAYYYFRPENVAIRSPWGAMHAMIAYGVDTQLIAGNKRVNAIGYLCYNGVCNGQQLFYLANGRLQTKIGPGVQGHPGQFLAMLAQSRVQREFPLLVEGQSLTVEDLLRHEMETCRPRTELTFKLIAFTHYLKSDQRWKSNDGQDWDIPRVIKEELAQPIVGAACGGTHRMTGFSYAVRKRAARNEPFTGQWLRAQKFVEDYHTYAFKLQNPDGSFSTDWFAGRADFGPPSRRLETTGHITEWLAFSLDKEQLVEPRMVKSVSYLTNLLLENRNEKWGIGPLGHGLHALAIYDERVFGGKPGQRADELAQIRRQQLAR